MVQLTILANAKAAKTHMTTSFTPHRLKMGAWISYKWKNQNKSNWLPNANKTAPVTRTSSSVRYNMYITLHSSAA